MEKLTLEEYEALGNAIKASMKNLKLIRKLLTKIDYSKIPDNCSEEDMVTFLGALICDLSNLSFEFEENMDVDYPDNLVETIEFFN